MGRTGCHMYHIVYQIIKTIKKAAEIYEVSYQQVYQRVGKYVDGGAEALRTKDRIK